MRRKVTGWLAGLPRRASRASGTIASASALIVCGGAAVGAGALGWGSDQPGGVRWENAPRLLAGYALEITRDPAGTTKVALRLPDADGGEIGLLPLWPVGFIPISLPSTGMRPAATEAAAAAPELPPTPRSVAAPAMPRGGAVGAVATEPSPAPALPVDAPLAARSLEAGRLELAVPRPAGAPVAASPSTSAGGSPENGPPAPARVEPMPTAEPVRRVEPTVEPPRTPAATPTQVPATPTSQPPSPTAAAATPVATAAPPRGAASLPVATVQPVKTPAVSTAVEQTEGATPNATAVPTAPRPAAPPSESRGDWDRDGAWSTPAPSSGQSGAGETPKKRQPAPSAPQAASAPASPGQERQERRETKAAPPEPRNSAPERPKVEAPKAAPPKVEPVKRESSTSAPATSGGQGQSANRPHQPQPKAGKGK